MSMPGEVKRSHQSALECVTVVDSTFRSKPPRSASMRLKTLPCTEEEEEEGVPESAYFKVPEMLQKKEEEEEFLSPLDRIA